MARIIIKNRETGDQFIPDPARARYTRLRRRVFAWANEAVRPTRQAMQTRLVTITLTYGPPNTWRPNDIRNFLLAFRARLGADLLAYAWVAELQRRGEMHYHVLLLVRRGARLPLPDVPDAANGGIVYWPHGMSRIETARSVGYIVKYISKIYYKNERGEWLQFPRGARIFAVWISSKLDELLRWRVRISVLPRYIRDIIIHFKLAKFRRVRGGYVIRSDIHGIDSAFIKSPWIAVWEPI